jgi:hypothetical protein
MPARLDEATQKQVDNAWDHALAPVDRLNHQALLDGLLASQAYQVGVDRLELRSEKRCAAGLVVMEIRFDRRLPADDQFSVRLQDSSGKILRQELFGREEIERTYQELFVEMPELERREGAGTLTPEEAQRSKVLKRREAALDEVFPDLFPATPDTSAG